MTRLTNIIAMLSIFFLNAYGNAKQNPDVGISVDSVTTITTTAGNLTKHDGKHSPEFDLKTNLLQDAVGTMSIGGEVKLSRRSSLDVNLLWNPWTFTDHTMYKQWRVSPEIRWWPRQKGAWDDATSALHGHFLGVHLIGGEYNYSRVRLPFNAFPDLKSHRFEGWFVGGGISYGYRYNVSRRFALEAEIGVGVAHIAYDKYACGACGERVGKGSRIYVGPTRAALSLILRIGRNPRMASPEVIRENSRTVVTRTIVKERTDTIYLAATPQETADARGLLSASFTLRLQYPLSSSRIVEDLGDNRRQIERLREFIDSYADNPDVRIARIDIEGWASIEGNARSNLSLSDNRAASAALLVGEMFPTLAPLIHARGMGEDWISPSFEGKERLMTIPDLDERERMLRSIDSGRLFDHLLRTSLPLDRRIECTVRYTEIK